MCTRFHYEQTVRMMIPGLTSGYRPLPSARPVESTTPCKFVCTLLITSG